MKARAQRMVRISIILNFQNDEQILQWLDKLLITNP